MHHRSSRRTSASISNPGVRAQLLVPTQEVAGRRSRNHVEVDNASRRLMFAVGDSLASGFVPGQLGDMLVGAGGSLHMRLVTWERVARHLLRGCLCTGQLRRSSHIACHELAANSRRPAVCLDELVRGNDRACGLEGLSLRRPVCDGKCDATPLFRGPRRTK